MRLGELIDYLRKSPLDSVVHMEAVAPERTPNLSPHVAGFCSWRGDYSHLALEPSHTPSTVRELLKKARASRGAMFIGWKGGEYVMTANTPVHIAAGGNVGDEHIVGVRNEDGRCVLLIATVETW